MNTSRATNNLFPIWITIFAFFLRFHLVIGFQQTPQTQVLSNKFHHDPNYYHHHDQHYYHRSFQVTNSKAYARYSHDLNHDLDNQDDKNDKRNLDTLKTPSRRSFLSSFVLPASAAFYTSNPISTSTTSFIQPANAAGKPGLVQFPCKAGLGNIYHVMRAGYSLMEEDDIWSTNPLFLTNREAALSETGIAQVETTCKYLEDNGIIITFVKYSLAANCIDTANIVGKELKVGRDRLVPEFTFMDPRAIGKWDMSTKSVVEPAIWAMDVDEAGAYGSGARPPPNDDGTPNETLSNQVIRLRQLMSVLETQYSGDNILLVFPDGTSPALLTALIGGIPLNRVHELNFAPGEIRLNTTYISAQNEIASPTDPNYQNQSEEYQSKIQYGREELQKLRNDPDKVLNRKDLEFERILKEEEEQLEQKRLQKLEADRLKQEELMKIKKEEMAAKQAKLEADRLERAEKLKEAKLNQEKAKEARKEADRMRMEMAVKEKQRRLASGAPEQDGNNVIVSTLSAVGVLGAIAVAATMGEDDVEEAVTIKEPALNVTSTVLETPNISDEIQSVVKLDRSATNTTIVEMKKSIESMDIPQIQNSNVIGIPQRNHNGTSVIAETMKEFKEETNQEEAKPLLDINSNSVDLFQEMIADSKSTPSKSIHKDKTINGDDSNTSGGLYDDIVVEPQTSKPIDPTQRARDAMEEYIDRDDGSDAWLGMLSDMIGDDDSNNNGSGNDADLSSISESSK